MEKHHIAAFGNTSRTNEIHQSVEGFAGINRIREDTFRTRKVSDVIIGFFVGFFVAWSYIFIYIPLRTNVNKLKTIM